jgi:alpha-L-glutamate ligase-like protein
VIKRLARLLMPRRDDKLSALYGINRRNVELIYTHNARRDYPWADDKLKCKARLEAVGVPVPITLAVCRGLFEVSGVVETLKQHENFVVKPARGGGGNGIRVVGERVGESWKTPGDGRVDDDELRQHLANIVFGTFSKRLEDAAFVERRIVPEALFAEFWGDGVCDLRMLCLEGRTVMAMIRVPTRRSQGRANLHKGGIGVAVETRTGRTYRAVSKRVAITTHPETDVPLLGRQIPSWKAVVEVAENAARAVPLGYVGVDIAIDAKAGPLVLELNARPGLEIQNVCGRSLGDALAYAQERSVRSARKAGVT